MLLPFWGKPEGMGQLVGLTARWESGSTGTRASNPSYVLSSVARHTDKFIDEYLRVNANACE